MKNFKYQEYRDQLAVDVLWHSDHKYRKKILEEERSCYRYKLARALRKENAGVVRESALSVEPIGLIERKEDNYQENYQGYRDRLARDMRSIENHELRKLTLKEEQKTIRYSVSVYHRNDPLKEFKKNILSTEKSCLANAAYCMEKIGKYELSDKIRRCNTLICKEELLDIAKLIIFSFEKSNIQYSHSYEKFMCFGRELFISFIGHALPNALDGREKSGELFEIRSFFLKLFLLARGEKDGFVADSDQEIYLFCKKIVQDIESLCLNEDVEEEYWKMIDYARCSREEVMKNRIRELLGSKVSYRFPEQYSLFEEWAKRNFDSFQDFIDEGKKLDSLLSTLIDPSQNQRYRVYYAYRALRNTLYRDDVVQFCQQSR